MSRLHLPPALKRQIAAAAVQSFPRECCGLLEGSRIGPDVIVDAVHPARNLAKDADRFEIDPADHFVALRGARSKGRAIVGCYHSHPNGSHRPSPRDLAAAQEEDFAWVIAALSSAVGAICLRAYEYRTGAFLPLTIQASSGSALDSYASQ